MAEKETKRRDSEDSIIYRRDTAILNKETFEFNREDVPMLVEILQEMYPNVNLTDYKVLQNIAQNEFGVRCTTSDFYSYFSPSIEGLADDYKYKLNMYE